MNKIIGSKIERIDEVGSSNNYAAAELLTKRLREGTVFVVNSQVDGRGQVSNRWESAANKNLTFSIVLYPDFIEIRKQFEISKSISLGVVDYLKELSDDVTIKWPNDIYIGRRKVAGILIENAIRIDKISSCIVGIGLNVNQLIFTSDAPNPVSLSQVSGKVYNLEESLFDLCLKIDGRYDQLRHRDFVQIDDTYTQMLYQLGLWACYSDDNGEFEGQILGVDGIGRLLIKTRSGKINAYHFKEVTFK